MGFARHIAILILTVAISSFATAQNFTGVAAEQSYAIVLNEVSKTRNVDVWLTDFLFKKHILIKFLPADTKVDLYLKADAEIFYGFRKWSGKLVFVAYDNMSLEEIHQFEKAFKTTTAKFDLLNFFFPVAHADQNCPGMDHRRPPPAAPPLPAFITQAGACVGRFIGGLWDSTVGLAVNTVEGLWSLISNPVGAARGAVEMARNIGNFFSNFTQNMGIAADTISSLPPDIRNQMICQILGNVAPIAAAFIFPQTMRQAARQLLTFTQRMVAMVPLIASLGAYAQTGQTIATVMASFNQVSQYVGRASQIAAAGFRESTLARHFSDHGARLSQVLRRPIPDEAAYGQLATNFARSTNPALVQFQRGNTIYKWNPVTNEYAVILEDRVLSYFVIDPVRNPSALGYIMTKVP